jgi:plastocyanin
MKLTRLIVVAAVFVVAACKSSTSSSGPGANQVFMQNTAFNPTTRTVAVGTTVTWMNQDGFAHTVTYSSGPGSSFDSGSVPAGGSFQHAFAAAGTVQYHCTIHAGMNGTIVVQ